MAESFFVHVTANLLQEGYSVRFQAKGTSMYPTIEDGERVVVEPVAPSQVKQGDIILYQGQRGVIAHRVVRIARTEGRGRNYSFILRGDASDSCDAPVEAAQVLGRVTRVMRDGRSIGLNSRPVTRLSAVRLCAARLRRAMSRRLPRVAYLLRTARVLYLECR